MSTEYRPVSLLAALLSLAWIASVGGQQPPIAVLGYAGVAETDGGAGERECLADSEPSLRSCLTRGARYVRVTRDIDAELGQPIVLDSASNDVTLDARGHSVTLRVPAGKHQSLFRLVRQLDNFIVINVRLVGNFAGAGPVGDGIGLFDLDGDPKNNQPITRVSIINSTFKRDPDGAPQPWCGNRNITFEGLLVMDSYHPFGHGCAAAIRDPEDGRARNGITTFRSVFARNGERQPQLREGVYNYDFVSNIVYDWRDFDSREGEDAGYGMLLRDPAIDSINIIGNAFLPGSWRKEWACVVGSRPGPDGGGAGLSQNEMRIAQREIFFARAAAPNGNRGGAECQTFPFKRREPNSRPYELPRLTLDQVLDRVGAQPRTPDETALIAEIRARLLEAN